MKDLITFDSHLGLFHFKLLVPIWREEGDSFEIGLLRSSGWKNFGRSWTTGVGSLENWTTFLDGTCASSLNLKTGLI